MSNKFSTDRYVPYILVETDLLDRYEEFDIYERMTYIVLLRFANSNTMSCYPSYDTLAKYVGCSKRKVIEVIKSLEAKEVVRVTKRKTDKGDNTSNLYEVLDINKGFRDRFKSKTDSPISENPTHNNIININNNKTCKEEDYSLEVKSLSKSMLENIRKYVRGNYKEPNWNSWYKDMDLLIRKDERDVKEVERLINWIYTRSEFWSKNILSPSKLRKQYDKLCIEMDRDKGYTFTTRKEKEVEPIKENLSTDDLLRIAGII